MGRIVGKLYPPEPKPETEQPKPKPNKPQKGAKK